MPDFNSGILQELMVKGFSLLCLWTRPLMEKFELSTQVVETATQTLRIPDISIFLSPDYTEYNFYNVTAYHLPSDDEEILVTADTSRCVNNFKTSYQASSKETIIRGAMMVNDTSTEFTLLYRNLTLSVDEIKTRTPKGRILGTRIKEEYNFTAFQAYTTTPQEVSFLLDQVSSTILKTILAIDPGNRIAYAGIQQNVKVAESYKKDVLRVMSGMLVHHLRTRFTSPYLFPASNDLPNLAEVRIDGLNQSTTCDPSMQVLRRRSDVVMKLAFSVNFPQDKNCTVLTFAQPQTAFDRTVFVKRITIRLEFSSSPSKNLRFDITSLKADIIEKYPSSWYEASKTKLNHLLGETLTKVVLSWLLYDIN